MFAPATCALHLELSPPSIFIPLLELVIPPIEVEPFMQCEGGVDERSVADQIQGV